MSLALQADWVFFHLLLLLLFENLFGLVEMIGNDMFGSSMVFVWNFDKPCQISNFHAMGLLCQYKKKFIKSRARLYDLPY